MSNLIDLWMDSKNTWGWGHLLSRPWMAAPGHRCPSLNAHFALAGCSLPFFLDCWTAHQCFTIKGLPPHAHSACTQVLRAPCEAGKTMAVPRPLLLQLLVLTSQHSC